MEVGVEVEVDRETETEVDREVVVEVGSEMGGRCHGHLDVLVSVGAVVDDGERLLEAGPADAEDISDQLTDGNHHLGKHTHTH